MKRVLLPLLVLLALSSSVISSLAQPGGYVTITASDDPNLVITNGGTYVINEYYCGKYGSTNYTINGLTFTNNFARVGGNQYAQGTPSFGGPDGAALATLSEGSQFNGQFDFTVPTTAGHNYVLELLFHDDAWSSAGQRVFTVKAGPQGAANNSLAANLDLAALGAGENAGEDVVVRYVYNSTGSSLEITMAASVNNSIVSGLMLLDVTGPNGVAPLVLVPPTNQVGVVGYSASFSCVAAGPSGITYQWLSDAGNPGNFSPVNNSSSVSGATTATLTLSNLSLAEMGNYEVAVTSSAGSVTSSPAPLTVESIPGLSVISSAAGLTTSGNFVVSEYYGANNGPLAINGLTFFNNNGRITGGNIATANLPNFGATLSASNLALISESDLYFPVASTPILLPTVAGRQYSLQLLFHDNFYSIAGSRIFAINAGLQNSGGPQTWVTNLDLAYLGAYGTNAEDVLLSTNFTGDGGNFEIDLNAVVDNPMISALTLLDTSAPPAPPLVNVEPVGTNTFVGRNFALSAQIGGGPLNYQWWYFPISGGNTNMVSNSANLSGATSNILTFTNATLSQSENYELIASDSNGSATTSVAQVQVWPISDFVSPAGSYPYANAIITNNARDYWRLNETAGTGNPMVYDSGPGANDATVGNVVSMGQPGPQSNVVVGVTTVTNFPGFEAGNLCMSSVASNQNDYITAPPLNFTTNTVTMIAWLEPVAAQAPGAGIMLSRQGTSGTFCSGLTYGITLQPFGDYSLRYFWNGNSADSGLQVPQNLWSMVALVITPTNSSIYVFNSNSITSWSQTVSNAVCPFTNPFLIANDTAGGANGARTYTGNLDEPAVFTYAMNFGQLLGLWDIANGITAAAPTASAPISRVVVFPGTATNLSSTVAGVPFPTLQWMMRPYGLNGNYQNVVNGGSYSGAQSTTLTINSVNASTIGDYVLVAANNLGKSTSAVARVLMIQTNNTPALIGEWITGNSQSLNDVSGYYASSSVHAGVPSGGNTPTWTTGPVGGSSALQLTGGYAIIITNSTSSDNDYRLDYDHNITNRFSIAFWAQGFPASNLPFVCKGGANNTQGWQVEHDSNNSGVNQPTLEIPGVQGAQQQNDGSGVAVTDSNWHHYCATYDSASGEVHFYLDGICVDVFDNNFPFVKVASAQHLVLGGGEQGSGNSLNNFFSGNLYDVRLYNYALQPAEVVGIMDAGSLAANTLGLYLGSTNNLVVGMTVQLAVTIPVGANATGPVTVTVTDNAPGVAVVEGENNPFNVTFAQGGPTVQYFTVLALSPGTISFSATASGLTAGSLTDMVGVTVVEPTLIGHWLTGGQTLQDQSGYNPGNQDGKASSGTTIGGSSPIFTSDVPPPYTGLGLNALSLTNYAVTISGSSKIGAETYYPTFDEEINNAFSFTFWAKGWPANANFANPWISKNGNNNNIPGWLVRPHLEVSAAEFVVRYTAGAQNNKDNVDMYNQIGVTNASYISSWHNYACTWDGNLGLIKLYVDGVLSSTMPNNQGPIAPPVDSYLVLGGYDSADVDGTLTPNIGSFFTGEMFDVRFYNYPLAFSEVESIYAGSNSTAVVVAADTPVMDVGLQGMVSISLPLGANTTTNNTITVTSSNPSVLGISTNGVAVTSSSFTITFPANGYSTARLLLSGLANGQSTITASGAGFAAGSATVHVYGPQLVGHWFVGNSNLWELSGFQPMHTHDGIAVAGGGTGDTLSSPSFLSGPGNVPPGIPTNFASVSFSGGYSMVVSNSEGIPGTTFANGNPLDTAYQSTFDDVIADHFTIAFWENCPVEASQGNWAAMVTKGGDNEIGFQLGKNGTGNNPGDRFNLFYSPSHVPTLSAATVTGSSGAVGIYQGVWTHVAVVFDSLNGYRAVYTNGVVEMEQTGEFGTGWPGSGWAQGKNHHLLFGSEQQPVLNGTWTGGVYKPDDQDNSYLKGLMYDARVYNYALTPAQIDTLMSPIVSPTLFVQSLAGGHIQIAWNASSLPNGLGSLYPYPAYQIYTTTSLREPITWSPSGLVPTLQNGQYIVTDTAGSADKFYLLRFVPQ